MSGERMRVRPEWLRELAGHYERGGEWTLTSFRQTREELDRELERGLYRYAAFPETVWLIQEARERLRRMEQRVGELQGRSAEIARKLRRAAETYEELAVREREWIEQLQVSVEQWLAGIRGGTGSGGLPWGRPVTELGTGPKKWESLFSWLKRGTETWVEWGWKAVRVKEQVRLALVEGVERWHRAEVRMSEEVKRQLEELERKTAWLVRKSYQAVVEVGGRKVGPEFEATLAKAAEEKLQRVAWVEADVEEVRDVLKPEVAIRLDALQWLLGIGAQLPLIGGSLNEFNGWVYVLRTGRGKAFLERKVEEAFERIPGSRILEESGLLEKIGWKFGERPCEGFVDRQAGGPTVEEAAAIADHVYYRDKGEAQKEVLPGGWKLEDDYRWDTLKIGIYQRQKADGTVEYVLANAGTDEGEDWKENVKQPLGMSEDMKNSVWYAEYFVKRHPNAEITFVGHSKGGAEAAANAVQTNKNAMLFNPARPSLEAYGLNLAAYRGKMTAYVVEGELLHEVEKWLPEPYEVVLLPAPYPVDTPFWIVNKMLAYRNHGSKEVVKAVRACKAEEEKR